LIVEAKMSDQEQPMTPESESAAPVEAIAGDMVNLSQVSVEKVNAELVRLSSSSAEQITAEEVEVRQAFVYHVKSETCSVDSSMVVAQQVQATSVRTGVLLASKVEGDVETLLDTPRALLVGVAAGVAMGLVIFAMNLISGKKRS
jgi:hypothetical protein